MKNERNELTMISVELAECGHDWPEERIVGAQLECPGQSVVDDGQQSLDQTPIVDGHVHVRVDQIGLLDSTPHFRVG